LSFILTSSEVTDCNVLALTWHSEWGSANAALHPSAREGLVKRWLALCGPECQTAASGVGAPIVDIAVALLRTPRPRSMTERMSTEQPGLRAGHLLALMGAVAALAALWRPWYAVDIPPALRDALAGEGAKAAAGGSMIGSLAQGLAAMLPASIDVTGWDAMEAADVFLCVEAVAVVALVLAAAGAFGSGVRVDGRAAAQWIAGIGAAGVVLVGRQLLFRPGADEAARIGFDVQLAQGAWIALAGCVAIAVGGALARSAPQPAAAPPVADGAVGAAAAPAEDRELTSVAPPGAR
jgi:hypothetical protein